MSFDRFEDRAEAGRRLAERLMDYRNAGDTIVLALPRGGVPVAYEIASLLGLPMDVFLVRKLGVPGHPEYAMGALASGGRVFLNQDVVRRLGISREAIDRVTREETEELERRERLYRAGRPPLNLNNRRVILVDDGLATGASMIAAARAVRTMAPKEVIVAVPVIAGASVGAVRSEVTDLAFVMAPYEFYAVGQWYAEFGQTTDEEVQELLSRAKFSTSSGESSRNERKISEAGR